MAQIASLSAPIALTAVVAPSCNGAPSLAINAPNVLPAVTNSAHICSTSPVSSASGNAVPEPATTDQKPMCSLVTRACRAVCSTSAQATLATCAFILALLMAWWTYTSLNETRRANDLALMAVIEAYREDCRAQRDSNTSSDTDCVELLSRPLPHPPWMDHNINRRSLELGTHVLPQVLGNNLHRVVHEFTSLLALAALFSCLAFVALLILATWKLRSLRPMSSSVPHTNSSPATWVPIEIARLACSMLQTSLDADKDWQTSSTEQECFDEAVVITSISTSSAGLKKRLKAHFDDLREAERYQRRPQPISKEPSIVVDITAEEEKDLNVDFDVESSCLIAHLEYALDLAHCAVDEVQKGLEDQLTQTLMRLREALKDISDSEYSPEITSQFSRLLLDHMYPCRVCLRGPPSEDAEAMIEIAQLQSLTRCVEILQEVKGEFTALTAFPRDGTAIRLANMSLSADMIQPFRCMCCLRYDTTNVRLSCGRWNGLYCQGCLQNNLMKQQWEQEIDDDSRYKCPDCDQVIEAVSCSGNVSEAFKAYLWEAGIRVEENTNGSMWVVDRSQST